MHRVSHQVLLPEKFWRQITRDKYFYGWILIFWHPQLSHISDYPNDVQRICAKFDDKRYFSVRFRVSDEIRTQKHEALSETHVSGWSIENMDLTDSKYVLQTLGNDWKQNPFDIQTNNCEICLELKRNAVYYISEMLLPMLVTTRLR